MVDTVARHLNIFSNDTDLQDNIFSRIFECICRLTKTDCKVKLTDKVSNYLNPNNKEDWRTFQNILGLTVPKPDFVNPQSSNLSDKFKNVINWKPNYDWLTISFEDLTLAICANNYQQLPDAVNLKSKYEIYVGVMELLLIRLELIILKFHQKNHLRATLEWTKTVANNATLVDCRI